MATEPAGYHGAILEIDLSTGTAGETAIPEEDFEKFVGGRGLGIKLLWDRLAPGADPLAPENPLMFLPGPFSGFPAPAPDYAGRALVWSRYAAPFSGACPAGRVSPAG